jgi:hypothetical protein
MFKGNGTRLVGDDGFSKRIGFGAEIIGTAAAALPVGTYLIIAVAAVSAFPANTTGLAAAVGDIITIETGITVTPAVGDDVVTLTLTDECDISSWMMDFSKDEIETTVLCDAIKVYRSGKADMAGTLSGIFVVGTTDDTDGGLRGVIPIVRQDGATSMDRYEQTNEIKMGFFYINDDASLCDKMWVAAPYQEYGRSLGGEIGSPQSFSSAFRFATLTYTSDADVEVAINPTFYRLGDGV